MARRIRGFWSHAYAAMMSESEGRDVNPQIWRRLSVGAALGLLTNYLLVVRGCSRWMGSLIQRTSDPRRTTRQSRLSASTLRRNQQRAAARGGSHRLFRPCCRESMASSVDVLLGQRDQRRSRDHLERCRWPRASQQCISLVGDGVVALGPHHRDDDICLSAGVLSPTLAPESARSWEQSSYPQRPSLDIVASSWASIGRLMYWPGGYSRRYSSA